MLASIGPEALAGRTILNVTSGTPDDARAMHLWTQGLGMRYLDGAILAYPEQIGTEAARILVAGATICGRPIRTSSTVSPERRCTSERTRVPRTSSTPA